MLGELKGLYDFEAARQAWASQMAGLLIEARDAAAAARHAGGTALDAAILDDLLTRYRDLATAGRTVNLYRRTAKDARRLARRFRAFEDMILRFAPTLTWTSSRTTKPSGRSGPPRSSSAAQGLLAHSAGSGGVRPGPVLLVHRHQVGHQQTSGASANSTHSAGCSPARRGSRPHSNPPDNPGLRHSGVMSC